MADNKYRVEYSVSGRAKCKDKDCKEIIDKGALRIAKMSIDMKFNEGELKNDWYHAPCWFNAQTRVRPGTKKVESTDDLEGYDDLKSADKQEIKDLIAGKKGSGGGGGKKKKAKGSDDDEDEKPKKKAAAKKKKKDSDDDEEDEKPKKKRAAPKKKKGSDDDEDGSDDDEPKKKKKKTEKKSGGGGGGGGKEVMFEVDEKFWSYKVDDDHTVTYRWGKIGANGQTKEESHANAASAQKAIDKLVRQKEKKGYEQQ